MDLDLLSSKESLDKCVEFDLPPVAVGDSTRGCIIRNLRVAISGTFQSKPKAAASAKKNATPGRGTTRGGKATPGRGTTRGGKATPAAETGGRPSRNSSKQSAPPGRRAISQGLDNPPVRGRSVGGYSLRSRSAVSMARARVLITSLPGERREEDAPQGRCYGPQRRRSYLDLDQDLAQLNWTGHQEDAGPRHPFSGSARRQGGRVAPLHPGTRMEPAGQSHSQVSVPPMAHFRRLCRALDRHYSPLSHFLVFLAGMLATLLCVALTPANQYL
ncbi:uncharacterized protein LOC117186519 isoform X1 [Drosophila miranda]|uniref:uncharacterized protein LOC117186519 isoform X1 n=1 Tax=Drosophila miranda TaxID=7229 RepID=UPI00143F2688|nr:uncharacterized protein LOC117186519 isoform X1 [Drosophila miranda]XP_033243317.1 uncharacterized protein LOC117186519 isoform X1 [Drosophila miranda]